MLPAEEIALQRAEVETRVPEALLERVVVQGSGARTEPEAVERPPELVRAHERITREQRIVG
jgi:hypothetical protein